MTGDSAASISVSVPTAVQLLVDARSSRRVLAPLSETFGEFTLEHAYAIQDALREALDQRGERMIGWKLGATSPAGQAVMGLKEPASGFLLPGLYAGGGEVPVKEFVDLRVEAEVAFRMRSKLVGPGVTAANALLAVESAVPALELLDFMFSGTPCAADFIANSVIGKAIVLGSPLVPIQGLDLAVEEVVYEHNGEVVGTYTAAEVMGDPLNALAWLANHLATRGLALRPGDVVMSGAISKMLRPKAGDTIRAKFAHLGSVSVKVVP
jgi:2-keto-4-pentenoate hydratase